ncbi:formate dehydrogenase major subunit [Desulfatibacillum alkenivorans DSM 16219]|jgi:formate dehydrogenase major subunit|nr:formate dehydrogenase major subunit [Desulfatibacillum alkenivorans DSM 16219]
MKISRRGFFKTAGAGAAAGVLSGKADKSLAALPAREDPFANAVSTTSVCPFCAVGCGTVVKALDGKVVQIEGDPEHPINQGALCSKGLAFSQTVNSPGRLQQVMYRAPGSDHWEEKSWEWALPRMAALIKKTRDASFVQEKDGRTVNRTEGLACLGGAALDNEECYLYAKLARALGVVYLEHQARI